MYVLKNGDELLWRGQRPWTMWNALVTDQGFVAGYAYTQGLIDPRCEGEFHTLLLSPKGDVLVDLKEQRTPSHVIEGDPYPMGAGLVDVSDLSRIIVRVVDREVRESGEEWRCFELPSGKELWRKRPREGLEEDDSTSGMLAARAVRGTPLVIARWSRFQFDGRHGKEGSRFALFDADLKPVWTLESPDDCLAPSENGQDDLMRALRRDGGLLPAELPNRFVVWSPASSQRVEYRVEARPGFQPPWVVTQVETHPLQRAGHLAYPAITGIQLEDRGVVELESSPHMEKPAVRDIDAFTFGTGEVLRIVRHEDAVGTFTLLHVDHKGRVLDERPLTIDDVDWKLPIAWWPISDHAWLVTQSPYGDGAKSRAWNVDDQSFVVRPLGEFASPRVHWVAGFGDGRFVVLAERSLGGQSQDELIACAPDGRTLWRSGRPFRQDDDSGLLSPSAVAVTTDEKVVLVDDIAGCLQVFEASGQFLRKVDLAKAWGQKPRYPNGIQRDIAGAVLVYDFDGGPPLWRMTPSGVVRSQMSPRFADGRIIADLAREAKVAPDGTIWTSDGQRLMRLDEKGVVDLQIGAPLVSNSLTTPSCASVDMFGRLLVQDRETGAVHVFSEDGHRLFVCQPDPPGPADVTSMGRPAATRDGGVVARLEKRGYSRFDGHGHALGRTNTDTIDLVVSPISGFAAGTRYDGTIALFDSELHPLKPIERRPDHMWLRSMWTCGVCANGVIGVIDHATSPEYDEPPVLSLYSGTGEPQRTVPLQPGVGGFYLALTPEWALTHTLRHASLINVRTGVVREWQPPGPDDNRTDWALGFSSDGRHILALELPDLRLHRFALP